MCDKDPQSLTIDFVANLELLAEKNKAELRSKFLKIENNLKKRLHTIFSILNQRGSFNKNEAREYEDECIENEEEIDASTHFLRIQKKQLIGLMQHLEKYTNTLPVFGFNSGRYIKKRLHFIFSILNERGSFNKSEAREYEDECIENEEETDASTHFLRIQKKQLIGSMHHLERYTNTQPVFGFNSGRYDINLIKYYLIP